MPIPTTPQSPEQQTLQTYQPVPALTKAKLNAQRVGANFLTGITDMTVAPINYLNNKLGITDDKETARINAKINSGEGIDLGLPKSYVDEGDQSEGFIKNPIGVSADRVTGLISGLAKIAPAIITAGDSGGASFFLQGTGQAAENIAKAKANGVKFNNHADDMFILGSGIINYALGKSVSGTVMNKLAPGLQNDIVGGLAAEATKGLGQLGADATAKDVANYYTQTAMNFGQRLQQYGLGVLKTLPTNMTDFATANLLGSGLKAATNKLSGNNPMGDVSGDEIVKDISSSLAPAIGASVAHGVLTGGMLFDKSPYMNPVIESLQKDNSPEGVAKLQDQITNIGKQRGWTDDEISNTQEAIHGLSDIVNTLPSDLPPHKFHEAVTTIMDRGKLQNISNEIESRKANYDSAISGKAAPFEDMVNAQKDKLNDKLVGLFTDQPYHYFEKDGEFFKQHGYEDPEQITKARWDLENLENDNQPKSAQSDVYEEPVKEGETNKAPEPEAAEQTAPPKEPFAPKATPAPQEPTDMMDDLDKELEAFKQQSSPTPAEPIVTPTSESGNKIAESGNKTPENGIKTTENEIKSTESEINKEEPTDAVQEQTARKMGIFDQSTVGEGMGEQNGSEQPAAKSNASEPIQTNEEEPKPVEPTHGLKVGDSIKYESKANGNDFIVKSITPDAVNFKTPTDSDTVLALRHELVNKEVDNGNLKVVPKEPVNKPYYVNMPHGHVEIPGKPVANDHGLDLFSHNMEAINGKGYGVSEGSTGLSIGKGKTEEEATANAKQNLSTKTPAEMQAIIKKQHEAGTKSPRGIIQPGSTDTAHTEDVIAKATTTLGKAKAASGGTVKSAGIIDAIDESVKKLDKEIKDAGGDPNAKQEDEEPDNEPPKGDKKADREAKKAKVKERLDKAKKEFLDSVRKYTNAGIHPETLAKGLQMMKAYADAGLLKFSEIAEDLADEIGENLRDVFAALKASYLAYGAEATDEEAEQMDDTKAVRKANIDDYLTKKEENGSASKPVTLDENTPAVDEGKPAGKPTGNEQQRGAAELPATENGGSSAVGSKAESTGNEPGRSGQPGSGNDTGTGGRGTKRGLQQPDNGSAVQPNTTERTIAPENQNHVIKSGDTIVPTGTVGKFNANADTLFLLKKLEAENRNPTPAEKQQLAQFTGWGGLAKYLSVPNYKDGEAVSTVMNGGKTQLYNNSYQPVRLDFTNEGPIDLAKYDNMNDLVNHVKQQLANAGYSIAPDAIRAPLLKAMLSNNEYQAAQSSTVTAYYTEQRVINSMWNIVQKLGFTGGRALESSAGIGHILGLIPKELRNKTALTAYELDNVTGRMLKKLYPQANITVGGFEAARVPNNSQDLVITNVPFGQTAPYDKNFPELSKFSLHNYFIGKNLKLLKPGGVAMIITSSSTMDAANSGKFREWVNSPEGGNSYLVGAIRLPSNVFDENAGTQVTSDILVFQKRNQNNDSSLEQPFRYSKQFAEGTNSNGETVPIDVNEYYHEHPENMLGTMMTANDAGTGNRYGDGSNATLKAADNFDLQKSLDKAEKSFPSGIIANVKEATENVAEPITAIDKKEGSLFVKGDKIYKVQDGDGIPVPMDAKQQAITKAYVPLKEGLLNLIRLEQSPVNAEANIDAQRKELNKDYDAFIKKYGNINSRTTNFLSDADIDFPIVSSLENVARSLNDNNRIIETITKGDILTKRINFPRTEPTTATDMKDAINISLNYRTGLDLNYMARMLGKDVDELKQELLSNELAYENPDTGILETPEEYLSGFVRDKLRKAEVAAVNDPAFKKNVAELNKVIPEDIPSSLISYSLGSSWIPDHIYEQFAKDIFDGAQVGVKYLDKAGKYLVTPGYGTRNAAVNDTYAAGGMNGVQILDATLNNRQIIVNDTFKDPDTGSTKTVKNVEKTAAAQGMQAMLQEKFEQYVKSNEPVQRETERIYNDVYNGQVLRQYRTPDFKHYPGAAHTISLRQHQKTAVSRGLSDSTLFAHEVGSGKTYTIITTAMEMRRLGTARKPMIGVQNSTLGDFVADFKKLYPSAKILAPTEKEMAADGRKKLFAKIATGDWDAIILPHSQVTMIPDDPERQKAYIREQIEEMKETMAAVPDKREANKFKTEIKKLEAEIEAIDKPSAKGSQATAKAIGKKSLSIEAQMQKAMDRKVDNILNFEQLGVDALLMDEAHKYKRLGFQTSMQNIKGIDTSRSQRSQSVLLKSRWVQEKTGGKNVNFYTGTPISNTMAEAWTMMKYLRPDILAHMGIEYFDQFAKTFGQVIPSLEQTGGGTFKIQNRFAKFQNLPEFITSFRAVTDVVLTDDVKEFQNTDTIPKLKDGKFTQVILPQSPELKKQIQEFKNTLDWFDKLSGREKKENSHIPLVIYNKAKQASIDLRLLSPTNVDSPQSKVNAAVDNAYTIYKETGGKKGVQMIFSDMYQSPEPKNQFLDEDGRIVNRAYGQARFNLFEDIKKKLIAKGVPADQIIIFTEPKYDNALKKKAVFADANSGKIRFLLGTTEKMGVGVNAQQKLVALHHLDAPARPMDFEQRNGRIIRQGNENKIVDVLTYGVEKTLDSSAFQRLSTKQKFINQIMKGQNLERVTEDPADESQMTFDEMMAHLSDSPYAMQKLMVDNKLQTEKMKLENFNDKLIKTNSTLRRTESELKANKATISDEIKNAEAVRKDFPDGNISTFQRKGEEPVTEKFGEAADKYVQQLITNFENSPTNYAKGGFELNGHRVELEIRNRQQLSKETGIVLNNPDLVYTMPSIGLMTDRYGNDLHIQSNSGTGLLSSIRSQLDRTLVKPSETQQAINKNEKDIETLKKNAEEKFDDSKLKSLQEESEALKQKMLTEKKEPEPDDDGPDGGQSINFKVGDINTSDSYVNDVVNNSSEYISAKTKIANDIIKTLDNGVKNFKISYRHSQIAKELLNANPELFKNIAFLISESSANSPAGYYDQINKLIKVFNYSDDLTAAHEMLHHSERFLPDNVRSEILKDWHSNVIKKRNELIRSYELETDSNKKQDLYNAIIFLNNAEELQMYGRQNHTSLYDKMMIAVNSRLVPKSFYRYINPSEWWAENASEKFAEMSDDRSVKKSFWEKVKEWYIKSIKIIKNALGITKLTGVEKGIKSILNGDTSEESNGEMLNQAQKFYSVHNSEIQNSIDYIKDQSNIKKGLDFLDSMKTKTGGVFMSTIIPIPPAVWNGAIDVMKNMLKATNSSQKAIRVAAKYIMDKGGSSAQAKDFEATMKEKLAQSKNASAANVPDTDEVLTEDGMVKAATVLQEKLKGAELSPDEKDFASMDLTDMNKKELHRYIEVASVLSVDPQGVLSSDVQDVQNRVNNRKNPKMGTAVPPPPTEPPTDTTLPGDEEEPIKPRGTIPKKEKIPMESVEELPEQTDENGKPIAKEIYSALGRIKDIRVRNLEQLKQFGKDIGDFTALRDVRQYATSKSQSSIVMKTATDRILKRVGKPGWDVLREALVESRLRGIRERWDNWAQQIKDSSDHDIDELFQDGKESVMYDVINKLEGYDDDANPAQTILGLISNGEYDDAREYMSDMFKNAATNVAYFDKLSNGKSFDDMVKDGKFIDPKMQEAFEAYKSLMAKPFEESHASNEGVFSDALGPLDTYYPLTPVGKDKHFTAGTPKYKAPENPNNKFATGQGDKYSTELSDLSNKLANAIRTNNKANAIKALENAGLIAKVSKDDPDSGYISVNGQLYTAVKVKTGDSMLVNNNGKTVQIPARYVMMPKWLYREVKPIFEDTGSLADDFSLLGRINDVGVKLMLGGPLEAIGHSYRLLGGILNSMPYMQEWAYKNGVLGHAGGLALNNPFVKIWAAMGKIIFSDINSEEALQQIQEMAKIGIIPEKTWQKTWFKEFAELTGAKQVKPWDWSPLLYGKRSIDLKARVTLYRLSKAMNPNATPEELVKMQNELGNYTMSLQGDLEKFVKHHGLAPFYSFGGAIYRSGVKSVLGQSDLPMTRPSMKDAFTNGTDAKTFAKYSAYKMAQLLSAGIMGLIGYWALTYKSETDKWPWEDKHSKLLKVPFPEWAKNDVTKKMWTDQGQYRDMDFAFLNPFVNRGVRALGMQKAYESNQLGGTAGQTVEAGAIQAINTNLSPYTSSPALNLGVTAITGDAPYITGIRDKYAGTPGISLYRKVNTFSPGYQIPANIATGVLGMNPLVDDVFSPVTKALKYKYSADDQDAYSAMSGVVNMMFPRLFSPHGSDEKKEALMNKQQKAIQTSIKKEKVKEGR